jgi:ferredoxin
MPVILYKYSKAGLYNDCERYHINYCIDCGACVQICPADIPLLKYINTAKRELADEVYVNDEIHDNNNLGITAPPVNEKTSKSVTRFRPVIFLTVLFILAGVLLNFAGVLAQTSLESRQDPETLALLQELFPKANCYTYSVDTEIYTLYNGNFQKIGYAFYGKEHGYRSDIVVLIGVIDKETIKNIIVISQAEDWVYWRKLSDYKFFEQFVDLKVEDCFPSYSWSSEGVNAVTGATVSSWAITNAVREAAIEKVNLIE